METSAQPRYTQLLSNEAIARAERMKINCSRRFTNRHRGEHLSGKGGSSIDFSDYRDYVDGDDTRFIDWNIFSRLRRPYIKLFHQEEELHVTILVDASSSMEFEGKLAMAKSMAAAFGVMGLYAAERVSVFAFRQPTGQMPCVGSLQGRAKMNELFRFIEKIEPGGDATIDVAVDQLVKTHRGRGVAIVLSDFLTHSDLTRPFNTLVGAGMETFALQILGPTEMAPELSGDLRLVDAESQQTLDITSASGLLETYHRYLSGYQRRLGNLARQRGGKFLSIAADEPVDQILFDQMRRKGWTR